MPPAILRTCTRSALRAATLASLAFSTAAAAQPVREHHRTDTFLVRGETARDLLEEMRRSGPPHEGSRVFGYTSWTVRWSYRYEPDDTRGCEVTHVEVELETVITLPEWSPPAGADTGLVDEWGRFLDALTRHEEGHKAHGVAAARAARRELGRVRAPACSLIEDEVNMRGEAIIGRHARLDKVYDEETGRGAGQGAVWPPRPSG